jgi:integrase
MFINLFPPPSAGGRIAQRLTPGPRKLEAIGRWRSAVAEIGREKLRVHDLRHTYASLSRRAGADLRLLQKAMGHASITVTAHTYADLFDDEPDNFAVALESLSDF